MMRYAAIYLAVCSPLAHAQTPRPPEPVPSAAAQMFEQLASGDPGDWIPKADALHYLATYDVPDAAARVKAVLDDADAKNGWLRGRALVALARIESANAAGLAKTYSTDTHPEVRAAAAEICADLPPDVAAPLIGVFLKDPEPPVRFRALAARARHAGEAAWGEVGAATSEIPPDCTAPAARALGWVGNAEAISRLLAIAKDGKSVPAVLRGVEGIPSPSLVPFYVDLIAISGEKVPLPDVWQGLRAFDRELIVSACRDALASGEDAKVQAAARLMVRYLREPELGAILQAAMGKTQDRNTLLLGLSALSCIEAGRFRDTFVAHLSHADVQVRISAVRCLAQCVGANLYQVLEAALSDADPSVTIAALAALRNAPAEDRPAGKLIGYFTPCLLSPNAAIRKEAIAAVAPAINPDNGGEGLAVMREIQEKFGTGETKPLMDAVFRMVPDLETAAILEAHGFVAKWHVIGAFPAGFGAPVEDVDGFSTAYPPEEKIDLGGKFTVSYNTKSDKRFGKEVAERGIEWVPATVENADGILFMTKAGRSQLEMPLKHGASYAFTEINIPAGGEVRMDFLFNMKAQKKVWLNGAELRLESNVDQKEGTDTASAKPLLNAGKNRILVKVVSDDGSAAWWAPKVSTRGFSLILTDTEGKPLKWSHE